MFLVRLQMFDPLVEATARLAQIANEADVKFTPLALWVIASNRSPRFVATLQLYHHCFADYTVDEDYNSRISLQSFHDALLDGGAFSSMTIHLLLNINQMILRFESSSHAPQLRHELVLLPSQEAELEEIEFGNFVTIDSRVLRHVIKALPLFHDDSVCVTVSASHVKFSIASREIIVQKQVGQCEIVGYQGVETQIKIILHPMLFFLNFTYETQRISLYRTVNNSHGVMIVPTYGFYAQYVIYFPHI